MPKIDLSTLPGQTLGHGYPDWPKEYMTFAQRRAYQRGVAHARAVEEEARKERQHRGTVLLERARAYAYNAFEPDNQSQLWKDLDAFLKETGR